MLIFDTPLPADFYGQETCKGRKYPKSITKSIGAGMTGYLSFDVEMPSSNYNACISCGRYANGGYYEHDEKCCIYLVPETAPVTPCSIGINATRFEKGDTITVKYYDAPQGTRLDILGPNNTGVNWRNLYGEGTKSYTFKDSDITGIWSVIFTGDNCNKTIRIGLDVPAAVNTKLRLVSGPDSIGVGGQGEFVYQLKEDKLLGKSLQYVKVRFYVDGKYTFNETATDKDGKVKFVYVFNEPGDHEIKAMFIGAWIGGINYRVSNYVGSIDVTAPKSAYLVTACNMPAGKAYTIKAFEGTSTYWDPAKAYLVTSLNDTCEILRSDMTTPKTVRTIKLFDEKGKFVYATPQPIRALKSTNDRLAVNVYANEGKEYRINMSHTPNTPAVNKAFDIEAKLIIGQSTPAGAGQSIIFKEEVAEGQYVKIGARETNDFGVATYQHPGKAEEGSYKFIAAFEYGEASCDVHTVNVGEKPSGFEDFLVPLFKWIQEIFNVDPETAKTYTYVGIGVLGLVLLGGFLK